MEPSTRQPSTPLHSRFLKVHGAWNRLSACGNSQGQHGALDGPWSPSDCEPEQRPMHAKKNDQTSPVHSITFNV